MSLAFEVSVPKLAPLMALVISVTYFFVIVICVDALKSVINLLNGVINVGIAFDGSVANTAKSLPIVVIAVSTVLKSVAGSR